LNSISGIQWQHTNQHSLSSWTSLYHLKLWPHGRQTVQHISWSQGCSTSLHISKSILQTFTSSVNHTWYLTVIVFYPLLYTGLISCSLVLIIVIYLSLECKNIVLYILNLILLLDLLLTIYPTIDLELCLL